MRTIQSIRSGAAIILLVATMSTVSFAEGLAASPAPPQPGSGSASPSQPTSPPPLPAPLLIEPCDCTLVCVDGPSIPLDTTCDVKNLKPTSSFECPNGENFATSLTCKLRLKAFQGDAPTLTTPLTAGPVEG